MLTADSIIEEKSARALDALPAAIYMTDAEGRLTYFNDAAAELWGYRPPLGKAQWCGSWQLQSADGHPLAHQDCPMAIAIKENRAIQAAPAIAVRPDGTSIPFLAFPAPLRDESGAVEGGVNLLIDISQHRKAEELTYRLAAIVESSDDAIVSKNLNGVITSWNRGAERLFGYSADEAVGKHITLLIPKGRESEEETILASVGRGERVDHFDTVRRRKDGTSVQVSLTVSPIRNAYGTIIGASKIARDITERKDSENRIRMLMREVNHRVKNQFAVILSMIRETNKRAGTAAEFERQIRERIMALSRSHDLLVDGEWRGATLHDLVVTQVQPFSDENRIRASGELIVLSTAAVQYLGIALHELATNSARHGALSNPTGKVDITWTISEGEAPHLRLTWTETGGPVVGKISRSGFGRVVLERVAPSAVNGVGHLSYRPSGIVWTLDAPLNSIEAASRKADL
ncbi:PAS domain S-box protein [Borborobacter arsenicus]|nr:PAS domain S-box protein [Pseudaminobacter arsenicus]